MSLSWSAAMFFAKKVSDQNQAEGSQFLLLLPSLPQANFYELRLLHHWEATLTLMSSEYIEEAHKENLEIVLLPRGEREGNVSFLVYLGYWYQVKATDCALMLCKLSFPLNIINKNQEHKQLPLPRAAQIQGFHLSYRECPLSRNTEM